MLCNFLSLSLNFKMYNHMQIPPRKSAYNYFPSQSDNIINIVCPQQLLISSTTIHITQRDAVELKLTN